MMKKILVFAISVVAFSNGNATTINVPADYATIQAAINVASSGDTVLVQPGLYTENVVWPSVNGIKLLSAGDSSNTVIDGGFAGRVMSFTSTAIDSSTLIKGFKITKGQTTAWPTGAGIYINDASPCFTACMVSNNTGTGARCYGAGVVIDNSHSIFANCTIEKSISKTTGSYNHGGGFFVTGGSVLTMMHCTVKENKFDSCSYNYGAGIFVTGSSVYLSDVSITNNVSGNANYIMGTGLYVTEGVAYLTDVRINDNQSINATYNHGTALYLTSNSSATLDRVYITGNKKSGSARNHGGGIYCQQSILNATNVLVANNVLSAGGSFYSGGGIFMDDASGTLMNVTVANNKRSDAGTINGIGLFLTGADTVIIQNSIFWNTAGGAEISGTGATISYSDINGGAAGIGNINTDPQFVSAVDFRINLGSPCEATGDSTGAPAYDIENNPRPFPSFTNPDMGCYEVGLGMGVVEVESSLFTIYPNPANQQFTIYNSQLAMNNIEINNVLGEKVYNEKLNCELCIVNCALPPGIYFVRLYDEKKSFVKKLIVE